MRAAALVCDSPLDRTDPNNSTIELVYLLLAHGARCAGRHLLRGEGVRQDERPLIHGIVFVTALGPHGSPTPRERWIIALSAHEWPDYNQG
jgi:hypothetical protein